MLIKFLSAIGINVSVDSVLALYKRQIARLDAVREVHAEKAASANARASELVKEAAAAEKEAARAAAVSAKFRAIVESV